MSDPFGVPQPEQAQFCCRPGYLAVLAGIRREDKRLSLRQAPDGAPATLTCKVAGCYVRGGVSWT
ncbi:hypothetical protein E1292_00550 [Nonomuraea deserti]|uniref:Ig-like domain-containing protein n=1 Tax=Nonomuraea deserti TaxID=1848322 RepID=A0A4R4WGV5_9ACTN|nr:hypothetical protein [Nonomuraea deserti]TDD12790.1 hypothetical protein E1292_00550 [Nonomuraea deserti]